MGPKPSRRRDRSKYSFALWFFAVWNVVTWVGAGAAVHQRKFNEVTEGDHFVGAVHAALEPMKFWVMVLSLPAFGAIMMTYFLLKAVRESRLQLEGAR